MTQVAGIDIGGTFTDCVVLTQEGEVRTGKAFTTHDDLTRGFFDALRSALPEDGRANDELLADTERLCHATTVVVNTIIERSGARVGLLTTAGMGDSLFVMRGSGRTVGLPVDMLLRASRTYKPDPIVPRGQIREVHERVDCKGEVVVAVDEGAVREAIAELLDVGVDAIAICFLWSFRNPAHEQRARELVAELAPDLFVTCSHEILPKWGEYERAAGTAINAHVGPVAERYLARIGDRTRAAGLTSPLLIMQTAGGVISADAAARFPLGLFASGPVGGVLGSVHVGGLMGAGDVIATDMGGTSFDACVITGGKPALRDTSLVDGYEFFVPSVDVQSIGSGGGSIAWREEITGNLRVGPDSAGSMPGPACYGRGGEAPTVTDADLALGMLSPDRFFGGRHPLDVDAATAALERLGRSLDMGPIELAASIAKIVDFQMAELLRQVTIDQGLDARDFTVFAYGGAGPTHAGAYLRELGARRVVIPLGNIAGSWSALGAALADIVHVQERPALLSEPFPLDEVNDTFATLDAEVRERLAADGIPGADASLLRSVDLRYRSQFFDVTVEVDGATLTEESVERLRERFDRRYRDLYGEGAALRGAELELVALRVRGVARTRKPTLLAGPGNGDSPPVATRRAFWYELDEWVDTPTYQEEHIVPGLEIDGPAIFELSQTTVVARPSQHVAVDDYGNLVLTDEGR